VGPTTLAAAGLRHPAALGRDRLPEIAWLSWRWLLRTRKHPPIVCSRVCVQPVAAEPLSSAYKLALALDGPPWPADAREERRGLHAAVLLVKEHDEPLSRTVLSLWATRAAPSFGAVAEDVLTAVTASASCAPQGGTCRTARPSEATCSSNVPPPSSSAPTGNAGSDNSTSEAGNQGAAAVPPEQQAVQQVQHPPPAPSPPIPEVFPLSGTALLPSGHFWAHPAGPLLPLPLPAYRGWQTPPPRSANALGSSSREVSVCGVPHSHVWLSLGAMATGDGMAIFAPFALAG